MKHLLNDMSEDEKNRIREQHEGGMKVEISRFKNLLESTMGDVRPLISEQESQMTDEQIDMEIENMDENDGGKLEEFVKKIGKNITKYQGKMLRKLKKLLKKHSDRPRVKQAYLECVKL